MEQLSEVKQLLAVPKDIVITSHRNPDGDALGSSLGLYHYLIQFGHTVHICLPSDYPIVFGWMPDIDKIAVYDLEAERVEELLRRADVVFILDYNALERVDKMGEIMATLNCKTIMIDHHLYPEPCADYVLSETTASSTAELVYDFIGLMGAYNHITPTVADCLYTGIITDTGSFKYSTSPKLFTCAGNLLALGADDARLQDLIFNCQTEKHLRLLGHCLHNRMEILDEYKTGIITLTKRDYENFDIQRGDTEGIVNYLLTLKNIKMAAFITEQPNIVKISLRSKGEFSVQEICREYFRGGGHKNASGGFSHSSLNAVINKLKEVLPQYKEKLLAEN